MRGEILRKLTPILSGNPKGEADVAYALILMRKLLERDRRQDEFATLKFFCDWVVHTELSRRGARDQISRLDARLRNMNLANPNDIGQDLEIFRFISFDGLFNEMKKFCNEMGLARCWTGHPLAWTEFVKFYGEIVRDCPLEVKQAGKNPQLKRVVLKAVSAVATDGELESFELEWELSLNDARSFKQRARCCCPAPSSPAWKGGMTETEFGF